MKHKKFTGIITAIAMMVVVTGFTAANSMQQYTDEKEAALRDEVVIEQTSVENTLPEPVFEIEEQDMVTVEGPTDEDPIEEQVEEEPNYEEYTVQAGDSFWSIAQTYYGSGMEYSKIMEDNDMTAADIIHPGDVLYIYDMDTDAYSEPNVQEETAVIEETSEPEAVTVSSSYTYTEGAGNGSFDGELGFDEAIALLKDSPNEDTSNMTPIGTYRVTGYDPHCAHCCGKTNGITASGNPAEFGVSVGCNDLPLGTIIYVEGYGYFRVDDRGGMGGGTVDIACPSHDVCYQMTNNSVNVYIVG